MDLIQGYNIDSDMPILAPVAAEKVETYNL